MTGPGLNWHMVALSRGADRVRAIWGVRALDGPR